MSEENSITTAAEQRDAYRLDAELRSNADKVVAGMIEIGRCLKEINERKLYLYLEAGSFAEYAEQAVGLKERAAYNYITAYETYGENGLQKFGNIGITKLVALAQLNDADRTEMLESGKAGELSSRELKEEIKRLKGENDQLRFEADDAETSAKNNAVKIAAMQKEISERREEAENLKKQLAEAQRPVVADMTAEEKDEIRREAEKKARMDAEAEMLKFKAEMKKKNTENLEQAQAAADKELAKLRKDMKEQTSEQANKIAELTTQLEAARVVNSELQANAEKAKKPVIAGSKEALKFCLEDIQQQFNRAIEIVEKMEGEEKAKFRAALVKTSEKCKAAAEGIV